MRQILFAVLAMLACVMAQAQPGWVKKAARSVFTLKTFDADGNLIASSNGFFVGDVNLIYTAFVALAV